ncbi:3405_t:CDS:2, partial [Cetraspora pellucida]
MIKILEDKLSSAQKDVILIQNNSSKKETEITSLKFKIAKLENIKSELELKVNELEYLKSEAISNSVLGRNDKKNMTKFDNISAVIKPSKNLRQYFVYRKTQTSTFGTCFINDKITELPKIDTKVNFEVKNRTSISEINKNNILDILIKPNRLQTISEN